MAAMDLYSKLRAAEDLVERNVILNDAIRGLSHQETAQLLADTLGVSLDMFRATALAVGELIPDDDAFRSAVEQAAMAVANDNNSQMFKILTDPLKAEFPEA